MDRVLFAFMRSFLAAGILVAMGLTQQPAPPVQAPMPEILKTYSAVTEERLRTPSDSDWLMIRRTYDGWGYSPLDQINPANISRLQPAWVFATGVSSGHEAAPVVNNGVMFVSTPSHRVIAIDARTGTILWRYIKEVDENVVAPHPTSRGVALYGDKVFFAANDAVLVALNARTGEQVWTAKVAENKNGYYMTLAPLVAGGKVMVGASGGELGVRGFVAAYDPDNGRELWRTYTVPAPGEPGSETWPKGDQWKNGGAPVWVTGNYDSQTNIAYWGTGNGGPWMGDQRPGDNLYATSTIAIDVATGRIKGHHQYHPNDSWDWDEVSPPILVDYQRQGRTIKGLIDVARNGYLWFLERTDGPINFVEGKPYVKQNVFRSLDPKTGTPRRRSGAQAWHRQVGRLLSFTLGRQELAADRVQPEDADDLHPRERKPVRHARSDGLRATRPAAATPARRARSILRKAPITSAKCKRGTSTPASACGRTPTDDRRPIGARCSRPAADSCSAAAPTTASFTRSTRRAESWCGSFQPTRASPDSPRHS